MPYNWKGNYLVWNTANCYGYAARKNKWFVFEDHYKTPDSVQELLEKNPWRLVSKKDMVLGKRYVAYRYGARDFHFMYRSEKGMWRHKMGGTRVVSISQKDVFSDRWRGGVYNIYSSKLYLFEVLSQ